MGNDNVAAPIFIAGGDSFIAGGVSLAASGIPHPDAIGDSVAESAGSELNPGDGASESAGGAVIAPGNWLGSKSANPVAEVSGEGAGNPGKAGESPISGIPNAGDGLGKLGDSAGSFDGSVCWTNWIESAGPPGNF